MELSDTQKQTVAEWIRQGSSLAEVQERISEEFGISMTYMDVRFLSLELGVDVQDRPTSAAVTLGQEGEQSAELQDGQGGPLEASAPAQDGTAAGSVSVDVDRVTKPGSVVSGSVTFSDGVSASWWLDQFGKLAVDAGQPGYSPSQEDLQAFQMELRKALEKRGF